jgi:hypothetical protein
LNELTKTGQVVLWVTRAIWMLLPVTVGAVMNDALASWDRAPMIVAVILLYSAWMVALLALLLPRPLSFTVLRCLAPSAVVVTLMAARSTGAMSGTTAALHVTIAAVLALSASLAMRCAQAATYGNEQRFPLRVPPAFCIILCAIVPLIGIGIAAGPLLLAEQRWTVGMIALVAGWTLAALAGRSLHSLDRRYIVFVPAGLVVADPLTLIDPVLLARHRITALHRAPPQRIDGAVDTRLGAVLGSLALDLDEPGSFARRGTNAIAFQDADTVLFTPLRSAIVLETARQRRIVVTDQAQAAAIPPPSKQSPS